MDSDTADDGTGEATLELSIISVAAQPTGDHGTLQVVIHSSRGDIRCLLTACEGETGAAVMVGGAYGGFDGPADGVYARLAAPLAGRGISTLRVDYRFPNVFDECVLDVLAGVSFLKGIGGRRIALVGHSFGGAVAVKAAQLSDAVTAVVAMSPQLFGTRQVHRMSKPLLLVHGMDDGVLDMAASRDIYARANEPKGMVLLPATGHSLLQASDRVYGLLLEWLSRQVGRPERSG